MKILFMHNTIPEYRMEFMKELSKKSDVDFFITDLMVAQKIYGIDATEELIECNVIYSNKREMRSYQLRKVFKSKQYSVIVLPPADNPNQFLWGYSAIKIANRNNIKCIYWTEKWEPEKQFQPFGKILKNRIHRVMIGLLARRCTMCIAAGTQSSKYFKQIGIESEKIRIVFDSSTSPVCKTYNIRLENKIPDSAKIILYLGRIIERKGCLKLIQAFENIIKTDSNCYLIIGGKGDDYYNKCVNYVEHNSIPNIIFDGFIAPEKRRSYYDAANVFVLPSYAQGGVIEAWGLTVNEALECGTPVVATDCVGAAYDLLDGEVGVMVKQNNVNSLQVGIEEILQFEKQLVRNNCINAYEKFSVRKMAEGFIKVFEEVSTIK